MSNQILMKPSELLSGSIGFNPNQLFTEAVQNNSETQEIFHGVRCGELNFLIREGVLGEIMENVDICKIPQASDILLGMCSLRGNIIPIFNFHRLLQMNFKAKPTKVLVLGESSNRVGFAIEKLPTKITLKKEERLARIPPLPDAIVPFVKNCFYRDSIWIDWDIFGFFHHVSKQV